MTVWDWLCVGVLAGASVLWAREWSDGHISARRALAWIALNIVVIVFIIVT